MRPRLCSRVLASGAVALSVALVACSCEAECVGGERCDGKCIDLSRDIHNCGACGNDCPPLRPYCSAGRCQAEEPGTSASGGSSSGGGSSGTSGAGSCANGLTLCNGVCVDTSSDESHCGSCGRSCPLRPNGQRFCSGGTCRL